MRRYNAVYRLSLVSVFSALYLILAKLTISIGGAQLSFASLSPVFLSTCLSLPEGLRCVFVGQILGEIFSGTLTPTTPLWILPPILRILLVGLVSVYYRKKKDSLFLHPVIYFSVLLLASLFTSLANTAVEFLDALIRDYPLAFVLVRVIKRILISLLTAAIIGIRNIILAKSYYRFAKKDGREDPFSRKARLTKGLKK